MSVLGGLFGFAACASSGSLTAEGGGDARSQPGSANARDAVDLHGIPEEQRPAFVALEQAVFGGEDDVARQVLAQIRVRRPRGRALELVEGFERILDGRAVVKSLDLRLVSTHEASGEWRIALHARSEHPAPVDLAPGPASVRIERTIVDRAGNERRAVEYRPFPNLGTLHVERGKPFEVDVLREAVRLPQGAIAIRIGYELELRSGVARVAGRALPAMRLSVVPGEALELDPRLGGTPATAEDLVLFAGNSGARAADGLALAVRLSVLERARALDLIGARAGELSEISLTKLVPALRWISSVTEPGGAPAAWRGWLVDRERRRMASTERLRLILPTAPARP